MRSIRCRRWLLFALQHPRWEFVFQPKYAAYLNLMTGQNPFPEAFEAPLNPLLERAHEATYRVRAFRGAAATIPASGIQGQGHTGCRGVGMLINRDNHLLGGDTQLTT